MMKMIQKTLFLFVISIFALHCTTAKPNAGETNSLAATRLKPVGRTAVSGGKLELISSAAHTGFRFEGRECRVTVSIPSWLSHNYLQYEIDGVYQKRVRVSSNTGEPLTITAPADGTHTVWLFKATEAHTGAIFIHGINGKNVKALEKPAAPVIEFIGNSITCGAASDPSEVPCGTGVYHDQHNAYMAYGPRVARTLGANFILSSVSGIGVYRNWNSDGPAMPAVYERTDFQQDSNRDWDFSAYSPAIVSIALGTNDFSRGDGKRERLPFDSARFVNTYVSFVNKVNATYPAAKIALLSSPMVNGEPRELLQNCITAVKGEVDKQHPGKDPVRLYFFKPMQAKGCTGHPDVEDHRLMAEALLPFFKSVLQ